MDPHDHCTAQHGTFPALAKPDTNISRQITEISLQAQAWRALALPSQISLAGLWPGQARCMHFTAYHSTLVCLQITAKLGTRDRFHVEIRTILQGLISRHFTARLSSDLRFHGTARAAWANTIHGIARHALTSADISRHGTALHGRSLLYHPPQRLNFLTMPRTTGRSKTFNQRKGI